MFAGKVKSDPACGGSGEQFDRTPSVASVGSGGQVVGQAIVDDDGSAFALFVFNGEQFWGHDRIWLLEHVLKEAGLEKT